MDDLNPHDLSGTAWAFATLSYSQTELLQAISKASIQRLSEFNSQDLANTAWSFATCDFESRGEDAGHSDVGAMSSEVMVKLPEFAPQGLATTAWAYSNSKKKDRTLLEAISKEVMQKLYEIEPQSLGILADAKLGCQRHIEQALRPFAQKFAELLPKPTHNETGWVSVDDASLRIFTDFVREVRVDNFGAWGTRHILEQMRLEEPASDFISRAKDAILKAGETEEVGTSREGVLAGAALVHRRVFAYGEYHLEVPGSEPLTGAMARENGRRDRGYDPKYALIRPLASPISGLVDRGLCSEFQILAKLVDTVEDTLTQGQGSQGSQGSQGQDGQVQALPVRAVRDVRGRIQIFVSTSPCVSCLWALRQCQFHLPQVQLGVVNGEEVLERQRASMTRAQTELVQLREEKRLLQSGHAHSTAKHGMQVMPPTLLGAVEDEMIQGGLSPSQATGNRRATFANNDLSEEISQTDNRKLLSSCHSMPPEMSKPSIPGISSLSQSGAPGPPSPRGFAPRVTSAVRRNQNQGRQKTANNLFIDAEDMKAKVRAAIGQPEYNVIDFYKTSGRCQQLARKKSFENITLGVIMFNAIWLAIDTDFNKPSDGVTDPVFIVAEHVFCAYFFLEWWIRFGAFESKRDCLRDFWLVFDGFLMFVTVFETWLMQLFLLAAGTTDGGRSDHTGMIRLVRLLRIVRIARIARVLHHVPELLILVRAMVVAMRAVFFSVILLVLVLYVFGIAFTQLARDNPTAEVHFANISDSMTTLLLNGIFLDSVSDVVREIGKDNLLLSSLFIGFILVATLTVMNMLVGILVEVISVIASVEKEQLLVSKVQSKLEEVMDLVSLSPENDLTQWEFVKLIQQPEAARVLQDVGVDVVGLFDFVGVIFPTIDATLTFQDLMQVVLSLRGNNTATVKDLVDLRKCIVAEIGRFNPSEEKGASVSVAGKDLFT
eukprot:s185_g7.t2